MLKKMLLWVGLLVVAVELTGCVPYAEKYSGIQTQTSTSQDVVLEAVPDSAKTVAVFTRNDSGEWSFPVKQRIIAELKANGYTISTPQYAHYILQVAIKRVGYASINTIQAVVGNGYNGSFETQTTNAKKYQRPVSVADVRLVEKALYAPGGRAINTFRIAVYTEEPGLVVSSVKLLLETNTADGIAALFR